MRFVRIAQLLKLNIFQFQSSREDHRLLVVNIVVRIAVNQKEIMLTDNFNMLFGGNITRHVIRLCWIDSHVALCVDGVIKSGYKIK